MPSQKNLQSQSPSAIYLQKPIYGVFVRNCTASAGPREEAGSAMSLHATILAHAWLVSTHTPLTCASPRGRHSRRSAYKPKRRRDAMLMRMGRGFSAHNTRCEGVQAAPATHNTTPPPHGPTSASGPSANFDVARTKEGPACFECCVLQCFSWRPPARWRGRAFCRVRRAGRLLTCAFGLAFV